MKTFARVHMGSYHVAFFLDPLDCPHCNLLEKESLPAIYNEYKNPTGRVQFHGVWYHETPENCIDKNVDFYIQFLTEKGAVYYVSG